MSEISGGIRKRPMNRGVRLWIDFVLRQRPKPYISRKLFLEYMKRIFVTYLNGLRDSEEFEAYEAVLSTDNCSPHISDEVVPVFIHARVQIIIFATQTTYIFQILDVILFGPLKNHANGLKMFDEEQSAADFLLKVYHDFKQTMIEVNTWRVFAAIGFTHDIEQSQYAMLFDKEKPRQSPGFTELCERDTPLGSMSRRRQNAKFGWMDE
jgi:hypothetical protein